MAAPPSAGRLSSPPPTSAAVLEFICLFTHDLRRKQKRWQDGRLKYHTFNKRVMVYDERGNFVGDMHWRRDCDFGDGEEIELERGGTIVQVNELVHRSQQDLSELLDKRAKEKEQRSAQAAARTPAPAAAALPRTVVRPRPLGHRPLHRVIGTPTGHHGRAAVSRESPYEQRHQPAETHAESPDERVAKRRKYEPPPSKSGYAQALFGQSLTLSATPASSVPARRQVVTEPIQESDPRSSAEAGDQGVRQVPEPSSWERPKPALREQPKSSRPFNQPVGRPPASRNYHEGTPLNVDVVDCLRLKRKQDSSIIRAHNAARKRGTPPVDDDVVEIDQPSSVMMKSVRPTGTKKQASKNAEVRKPTSERASRTFSRTDEGEDAAKTVQTDAPDKLSKKAGKPAKLKLKPVKAKLAANESTAESAAPARNEVPHQESLSRRPAEPVTELRIKSNKRRGLMMMSEVLNKPRKRSSHNYTASPPAAQEHNFNQDGEKNDPFRSPSPQSATSELVELGRKDTNSGQGGYALGIGKDNDSFRSPSPALCSVLETAELRPKHKSTLRKHSTEFGEEEEDPLRSPSLAAQLQSESPAAPPGSDQSKTFDAAEVNCEDRDLINGFEDEPQLKPEGIPGIPAVHVIEKSVSSSPATRRGACDSYRQPSSSPEESTTRLPWMPASPKKRSFTNHAFSKDRDITGIPNKTNGPERGENTAKTKRNRNARRNIVLDDDDEVDESTTLPYRADEQASEIIDLDSGFNLGLSKEQTKPKKTTKLKKRIAEAQNTEEEGNGFESAADETGELEKPTRREATAVEKRVSLESEDAQPTKRRRSTRRTSRRTTDADDSPFVSEDEGLSKRSRKTKALKATEGRPRLTKIKKTHKSRELVGFNLAAMHAPLGLRGIEVPFSILSSPTNESIVRTIQHHATTEQPSHHTTGDSDESRTVNIPDPLEMIVEAAEADVNTSSAKDQHGGTMIGSPMPPAGPNGANARAESLSRCHSPRRLDPPIHPKNLDPSATRHLEEESGDKPREILGLGRDAPSVNYAPARERSSDVDEPEMPTREDSGSEVPHARAEHGSPLSALFTNRSAAISPVSASTKKTLSSRCQVDSELEPAGAVPKPITDHNLTPTSQVERMPMSPSIEPPLSVSRHGSRTATACLGENEKQNLILRDDCGDLSVRTAMFQEPVQNRTTFLSRQASRAREVDEGPEGLKVFEKRKDLTTAEQITLSDSVDAADTPGEIPAAAVATPFQASVHNLVQAIRRQPPVFKPVTVIKHNMAHVRAEAITQPKDSWPGDFEPFYGGQGQRSTAGLSRKPSDQGTEASAEEKSDTGEIVRTDTIAIASIQRQRSLGLPRTVSVTRRINSFTAADPPRIGPPVDPTAESSTKPPAAARLTNPASRGRKAALASHAAGPVPQRMIPPSQPSAMVPISTADLACTPLEDAPRKEPERPKVKMTFPGFQSAKNEGPWSREAFDLLESGRPG